jgi:hypothetical protein
MRLLYMLKIKDFASVITVVKHNKCKSYMVCFGCRIINNKIQSLSGKHSTFQ